MTRVAVDVVQERVDGAMRMFRAAERRTDALLDRTSHLRDSGTTAVLGDEVWEQYMFWLVCVRQIGVSISKATRAAGSPPAFQEWWDGLAQDATHAFFWKERNEVLKETADTITIRSTTDGFGNEIGYWVFKGGPRAGLPLVPVCQQYNEWLHRELLGPAREKLYWIASAS